MQTLEDVVDVFVHDDDILVHMKALGTLPTEVVSARLDELSVTVETTKLDASTLMID